MTYHLRLATAALLLATATSLAARPTGPENAWEWEGVPRVVAIGDIHGSDDKLIRLLAGAGLVNETLQWVGGSDHLVVAGDFLDRGDGDRRVMDLLRGLQRESAEAGGRVHVLLGNHEVMNLFRDTRHVNPSAYESFVEDEEKVDRKNAWRSFAASVLGSSTGETLRQFNREFPLGFFARQESFGPDGEYGSWLLGLPVIVKINGVVYLHGGLTEEFAALGVAGINQRVATTIRRHLEAREVLETEGLVTPAMRFTEIGEAANAAFARPSGPSIEAREASQALLESADAPILRTRGPLWYRGNSFEDERIERDTIERSLELVGAKAIVVAHSPTRDGKITSRFHGQLFRVDHGIGSSARPLALVVERGEILAFDPSNGEKTTPVSELPPGDYYRSAPVAVSDDELQRFLSKSEVIDSRDLGRGSTRPRLIVLEKSGHTRRGVFKTVEAEVDSSSEGDVDRYQHEVAAYRLDRSLGLEMVPVTVIREIESQAGSLQTWIERAIDRQAARDYGLDLYETEAAREQLALSEVFDALIGNHDRKPTDVLLPLSGGRIRLIDHSRAFSTSTELEWDPARTAAITPALAAALRSLDRSSLERQLGELLSGRQIEALLARRDRILARSTSDSRDLPAL